jgi:hypothetical protein
LCHHSKELPWRKSISLGQRLILASCELLIKKKTHNTWPWQLPLRPIASTTRQVANNIARALSSSSPHEIREHKNVKTILGLACQHAKSEYNNQEGKCYQLWTLQRFSKEWWYNLYLQPYQSGPETSQRKVSPH